MLILAILHTDYLLYPCFPMQIPGTYYQASGKFKPKRVIISTLIGILVAMALGGLYYLVSMLNPFIYIHFIALGAFAFGSIVAFQLVIHFSYSRHTLLNKSLAVLFCYLVWSTQWAIFWGHNHSLLSGIFNPVTTWDIISQRIEDIDNRHFLDHRKFPFDGSIALLLYMIEFGVFIFISKWVNVAETYYCEDCGRYYASNHGYVTEIDNYHMLKEVAGENHQYRFLPQLQYYGKLSPVYTAERPVMKVSIFYCEKCHQNHLLSMSMYVQAKDTDNKNRAPLTNEKILEAGLYVEKDLANALIRKFAFKLPSQ